MRRTVGLYALGVLGIALAASQAAGVHGTEDPILSLPATYIKRLVDEGESLIFVDLRPAEDFKRERLRGARSVPLGELLRRYSEVPRTGRVILYCDCSKEQIQAAYQFLRGHGYRNISVMEEGFSGWVKRGYPVDQ